MIFFSILAIQYAETCFFAFHHEHIIFLDFVNIFVTDLDIPSLLCVCGEHYRKSGKSALFLVLQLSTRIKSCGDDWKFWKKYAKILHFTPSTAMCLKLSYFMYFQRYEFSKPSKADFCDFGGVNFFFPEKWCKSLYCSFL